MTLALLELRQLARSPLLWLGVVLVTLGTMPDIFSFWPMIEGNDLIAHDSAIWLMGFVALAAGWLGLRDRRTGAQAIVSVTPASAKAAIVPARVASLVSASVAGFGLVFVAALVTTVVRGGHGLPDVRLYLDGAALVALGACAGYGIAFFTGSRVLCLLAAPLLPALNQLLLGVAFGDAYTGPRVDWGWLLPSVYEPLRSVTFGFLPDIWLGHIGWLSALVMLSGGGTAMVAARRAGARRTLTISLAILAVGVSVGAFSAAWLIRQPHAVIVLGPTTQRKIYGGNHYYYPALNRQARRLGPWPDDGRASACASPSGFQVCAYPEFGTDFARLVAAEYAKQAHFLRGLDTFPTRARMVPLYWSTASCTPRELLLSESRNPPVIRAYDSSLLQCVWAGHDHHGEQARQAITTWLFAAAHPDRRSELESGRMAFGDPASTRAGLALADMSDKMVRALLAPVWDRLVRGKLPLSELLAASP